MPGLSADQTPLDEAERQARDLLARAPDTPFGDSLLGQIAYERGQQSEAVRCFQRALEREPNDSDTMFVLCINYLAAGRNAEAREVGQRMVACDPLSPMSWMCAGVPHWFMGQAALAIPDLDRALDIDPQNLPVQWCMGYTYALVGRLADASRHGTILAGIGPDSPYTRQLLGLIDGLAGRPAEALARVAAIDVAPLDAHTRFHLAESFIAAGDYDRGLDLLEAATPGFHPYAFMAEHNRLLDPVRGTSRFATILATAKQHADAFDAGERSGGP